MKNHKDVLENLKKVVKEEIKDCNKYKRDLYREMNTQRAHKYQQIDRLIECQKANLVRKEKYEQVLEILKSIEF